MTENAPEQTTSANAKGKATPSRKEREAANRKTIMSDRSPEARKAEKAKLAAERARVRAGMNAGEEKYLSSRDRGPQRRMVRDIVDSRFTIGEAMVPLMVVVLLLSTYKSTELQLILSLVMWALMMAIAIDAFIIGKNAQKKVAEKFGADKVEKGLRWYAAVRSTQLRAMRLPKPQVGRGVKK
jgi:hypothetical protein